MAQINKPTDYFNTKLYTGTGSQLAVTGVGFQPDWIWYKNRGTSNSHGVQDVVRGFNTTGIQSTNGTDADPAFNGSTLGYVSAVGSDGFTVEAGNCANASSNTYVAWNWLAGGSASSNTDGSITSTVSANQTAGFSIVSYTGTGSNATVGHGLGVAPNVVIVKQRTASGNHWVMYNSVLPSANYFLYLDNTDPQQTATGFFNNTAPTSSVFTVGTDAQTNGNTNSLISYCFAEKKGYSKFGSYTGNGNDDGTFVYTGFKPAFVMSKCTSHAGEDWNINDNKRPGYNVIQNALLPNSTSAEVTASYQAVDTLSNGFKWRGSNDRVNASGKTYIYMAFAENPLVGTNNIPATAR